MKAATLISYVLPVKNKFQKRLTTSLQNRNFLFQGDWMQPFHRLVPNILEKMPVLIYAVRVLSTIRLFD